MPFSSMACDEFAAHGSDVGIGPTSDVHSLISTVARRTMPAVSDAHAVAQRKAEMLARAVAKGELPNDWLEQAGHLMVTIS